MSTPERGALAEPDLLLEQRADRRRMGQGRARADRGRRSVHAGELRRSAQPRRGRGRARRRRRRRGVPRLGRQDRAGARARAAPLARAAGAAPRRPGPADHARERQDLQGSAGRGRLRLRASSNSTPTTRPARWARRSRRRCPAAACSPSASRSASARRSPRGTSRWRCSRARSARRSPPAARWSPSPPAATPLTALAFAKLGEEAGVPKGVFSVLTGSAREIGGVLTASPVVRKLSFTGSTEIGVQLYRGLRRDDEEARARARRQRAAADLRRCRPRHRGRDRDDRQVPQRRAELHRRQPDLRAGRHPRPLPRRVRREGRQDARGRRVRPGQRHRPADRRRRRRQGRGAPRRSAEARRARARRRQLGKAACSRRRCSPTCRRTRSSRRRRPSARSPG